MALDLGGSREPMVAAGGGWWRSPRQPRSGDRYAFVVDGEGPFPDPRSRSQPCGVHGASEWVDLSAFTWTDAGWQPPPLASAVIYELHAGTFSPEGTFDGAAGRLDHLVDLGITHVELMPIAEFAGGRGWGYDTAAPFAPHHRYGGPASLQRFVDACHSRGLAVILDVVYNHAGPDGAYLQRFAPYFGGRHRTPWGDGANLDGPWSAEVRRYFCDNALQWLRDYHVDALRIDAVHALIDTSATHFLQQLADEVTALEGETGRHLALIAESDLNDPRVVQPLECGGLGMHAQWSDDFHHAVHAVVTGERSGYYQDFGTLGQLATAMREVFVYAGCFSPHRRRPHGRAPAGIRGNRFIVFLQNHDQIGNRARGERLGQLVPRPRLKVAAALLMLSPAVPMVFQGEEWAATTPFLYFTDHDGELGNRVREGRRREFADFGWEPAAIPDPQAEETFERSRLLWEERGAAPHRDMLAWYKALIGLRRRFPGLRSGDRLACRVDVDEDRRLVVVERGEIGLACNLGRTPASLAMPGAVEMLHASDCQVRFDAGNVTLPPDTAGIMLLRPA